jgi:hypothetical protein
MDERRADADLADAPPGVVRGGRWTKGGDAMGAVAARVRAHAPDPDLAALLVEPNGYAHPNPLALVAKTAVSPGAVKIDRGGPVGGHGVVGHSVPDLGSVRHPGASSAGLAGTVAAPIRFWVGRHKVLSAIIAADLVAMALWWA